MEKAPGDLRAAEKSPADWGPHLEHLGSLLRARASAGVRAITRT